MPFLSVRGGDIYYEVHGSGPPLVIVSGLGGLASTWRPQIPALADRYQVIVHDHRGCGQSTKSPGPYSVDQMAADVIGLMDGLGIATAHFLGHSTGGAIGQTLALSHATRLRSLALFATWCRRDDFFVRAFEVRKEALKTGGPAVYMRASNIALHAPWWISQNLERLAQEEAAALASFPPPEIVESRIDAICAFDLGPRIRTIATPTVILCARDDYCTPLYLSEEIAAHLPKAATVWFETGGHLVCKTRPDLFNPVVRAWLDAQEDGKAFVSPV